MDVATLAIKVENGEVVKATTALDSLAVAGGKTEAATQRLTRRMALLEIEARNMDAQIGRGSAAMVAMEVEARKLDAELNREARAMALVEIEARKMDAALSASKQAAFAAEVRKSAAAQEALALATSKADQQLEKTGKTGIFSAGAIKSAFAALGIGVALREFSQLSDTYTNIHSRLALVTTDTANLAAVQGELFDVAQRTRTAFEGTSDLYAKIARNAAQLGVSQRDVITVTETVSKAMIISGGSAESNRAAIVQLGQALASGTLRGDELNSVMEQAPRLAQAVADGLGVTTGQLRKMGSEGKLTSEEVIRALLKMRDTIDKEFTQLPTTIGGAWQQLRNEILRTVGAANDAGGMSGGIVTAIDAIRNAIPPAFKVVNAFFGGIAIGSADAAVGLEKVRQKAGEIQMALGMTLKGRGNPLGDFLIENAAKVLQDGDDILRMLEKQRDEVIKNVHAITTAGTVSTGAPNGKGPPVVDPNAAKDLEALQKATDEYHNSLNQHQIDAVQAISATQEHTAATRAMIEAVKEGPAAVEALTIAQAGDNAVRELAIGVSEKLIASRRRAAEEDARAAIELGHVKDAQTEAANAAKKAADEAARDMERRAKDLHRTLSHGIEGILTDIANRQNPFKSLLENLKRAAIHAIAEAIALKIEGPIGDFLGINSPAAKQEKAAREMNVAADKMLRAGQKMNGNSTAGGIVIDDPSTSTSKARFAQAMRVAGAGYGGYQVGYGIGAATGSRTLGAIGGAYSGFMLGNAIAPGIGGVVGGLAGLAGGIIGASDAAAAGRRRMDELRAAFKNTFDALKAELNHDTLGQSVAQVKAQYAAARQQLHDATNTADLTRKGGLDEYKRKLDEINAAEAKRIAQLQEETALLSRYFTEDLDVRRERALGHDKTADDLDFQHRQQRELDDYRRTHDMAKQENQDQYAYLQYVQGLEASKRATDANTKAINELNTSFHNAPVGYKYQRDVFAFATPRVVPGTPQWQVPTNPFVPPMNPVSPPQLGGGGTTAQRRSITIAPVFNIDGTKTTRAQVQQIGVELRKIVTETLGKDADVSEGWGLLA